MTDTTTSIPTDPDVLARQLRLRAIDIDRLPTYANLGPDEDPDVEPDEDEWRAYPHIADELRRIADKLDGGVGPHLHRGCEDPNVPTAQCRECRIVEEAEIDDPSYVPSVFTPNTPPQDA